MGAPQGRRARYRTVKEWLVAASRGEFEWVGAGGTSGACGAWGRSTSARMSRGDSEVGSESLQGNSRPPESDPFLQVTGISKTFGRQAALRDVSFSVRAGEIVGLVGPNGAGKSTTLRIVCGLLTPDAGRVWVWTGPTRGHRPRCFGQCSVR